MILIDLSQIAISSICGVQSSALTRQEFTENFVRHVLLSSIKSIRAKHPTYADETVIACDGKNYWRKEAFPYYKANRKTRQVIEGVDWEIFYSALAKFKTELAKNFPYKVIEVDRCEADDVIGTIASLAYGKKVMIVSSDQDFLQLQKFPWVSQWSFSSQKDLKVLGSAESFLREKIIKGDSGDGIPNILSDNDTFVTPSKRQNVMTKKRLDAFMGSDSSVYEESTRANFARNTMLIDLINEIPPTYREQIHESYVNAGVNLPSGKVYNYLFEHALHYHMKDPSGLI